MNQNGVSRKSKIQAGLVIVALGALVVGTAVATSKSKSSVISGDQNSSANLSSDSSNSSAANTNINYKNGTYQATGKYYSPGGQEAITVSLTLDNNVVTTASAQSGANDPTATSYQDLFLSAYKSQVVGKKINSIKLSNVSGSSLTSQGFNNAVEQIENQAKA